MAFTVVPDKATLATLSEGDWDVYLKDNLNKGVARAYDETGTAIDVVNTTTETVVYTKSIAANDLGTHGSVWLALIGDYFNDSAASRTLRLRVKFGGTTIYDDTSAAIAASAARRVMQLALILANLGVTNAQHLRGRFTIGSGPVAVGMGALSGNPLLDGELSSGPTNPTIDTTAAQTFEVTVQHSVANASLSFRKKHAALLYLPF